MQIAAIRRDLNDLRHSDLTLDQIRDRVAADEQAFADVLRTQLTPVGHVTAPPPATAADVSDDPTAADPSAEPTGSPSATASPEASETASPSPAASDSASPAAETPSPSPSP
jgi:hypothetical protein